MGNLDIPAPADIEEFRVKNILESLQTKGVFDGLGKRILEGLKNFNYTNLTFPQLDLEEVKYLMSLLELRGYRVNLTPDSEEGVTTITISMP